MEVECLDYLEPLNRLLHYFQDVCASAELVTNNSTNSLNRAARHKYCHRHNDNREQRKHWALRYHYAKQGDKRQHISAEASHERIDRVGRRRGTPGDPGREFRRVPVSKECQALLQQLIEKTTLIPRNDLIVDTRQRDRLEI